MIQPSGTVTFLFSDIEGSTQLLEHLGSEYASVLADQRDLLRATAEKHNGHEVDTQGDAFFFAFFRAADAVTFAAEAQRDACVAQVAAMARRCACGWACTPANRCWRAPAMLEWTCIARRGLAQQDMAGRYCFRETTHVTGREPNCRPARDLEDLGEHRLKDLRYPVHIVQLTIEGLPSEFPPLKSLNTASEPPAPGEPPFKGLQFFDEGDADLFFGREALVAKLASDAARTAVSRGGRRRVRQRQIVHRARRTGSGLERRTQGNGGDRRN